MKSKMRLFILFAVAFFLPQLGRAQATSRVIPFNNVATTIAGPAPGQALTIQLRDTATGGTLVFSEAQTLDVDANGSISFTFGSATAGGLDPNNFASGSSRFLDVVDSTNTSVLPNPPGRIPLNAVSFALSPGPQGPPGQQGPPGVVQAVNAGDASIVVGGTAANPTVAVAANGITNSNIANGSLSPAKIAGTAATLGANNFSGNQSIAGQTTTPLVTVMQSGTSSGLSVTSAIGVLAIDGTGGIGLRGTANAAGGSGIVGISGGFANALAGQFTGNVNVNGNMVVQGSLTVTGTKFGFFIDHPLDPANKYLAHTVIESPEMKNMYDGVAVLNEEGEAVVELPAYFEALNRDFRYQLTAIGAPGPNLYIAEEIAQNRFKIAGGRPGMRVSWQVTGIRQDAWAKSHPMAVEQEKPEEERGTYLHPEVFGQPEEKGVTSARQPELIRQMKESSKPAAPTQP